MFKKVLGWFKRHWITIICTILAGVLGAFNFYNLWSIGWYHRPVLRLFWDGCLLGLPLAVLTIGAVLSGAQAGAIVGGVGYLLFFLFNLLYFILVMIWNGCLIW